MSVLSGVCLFVYGVGVGAVALDESVELSSQFLYETSASFDF